MADCSRRFHNWNRAKINTPCPLSCCIFLFSCCGVKFERSDMFRGLLLFIFISPMYFFTDARTLCGSWPPPWFHNGRFSQGEVVSPSPNWRTRNYTSVHVAGP
jgi:hypothetical protein